MSPFAVKAIQLLLSLSLLIVLHELGHYIPAKIFKTRVEKFFLFFDVKFALFSKKIGETIYGIGWLPLGGYVKISGMIDESMDKEQMALPPQPWEFRSKPAWQRLIIMLGGVTVNIIVGFVIYMGILNFYGRDITTNAQLPEGFAVDASFNAYGFQDGDQILSLNEEPFENVTAINKYLFLRDVSSVEVLHTNGQKETIAMPEDIGNIMFENDVLRPFTERVAPILGVIGDETYPAAAAGFLKEDKIVAVNGIPIVYWHEFQELVKENGEKENVFVVNRGGAEVIIKATPNENGQIGLRPYSNSIRKEYSFGESVTGGIGYGIDVLKDYVTQFKYVFTKKGASQVGGFGAIGGLFPDTWDWVSFWQTTALISIILAFMNILPIPALDGGHVMFLLYEMVSGRKPNDKFMEYAQIAGFFLLIALVLFANGNDIYRYFFGG
ncbi:MAG: regulator of sigma E protease [Patiriisocius sp.]|jgi:regulator of sigma E protease